MDGSTLDENFLFANFEEQPAGKSKSKKSKKRKISEIAEGENGMQLTEEVSVVIEQKEKYIQQLEDQNNKLKAVIKRVCGPQDFAEKEGLWRRGSLGTMPMAVVLYLNNELSFACKKDVEESMVTKLANDKDLEKKAAMTQDPKTQPAAVPLRAFAVDNKGKRAHKAKKLSSEASEPHVFSAVHYYLEFCIDRTGLPLLENNPNITEIWTMPVYEQIFLNALPIETDDGRKVILRQKKRKTCFNCLGDHNVSECDQPRNSARINANRQEFRNQFGGSPGGDSRYHQGDQERFKEFKAGKISEKLREALSIKETELPPYIYKMRSMGYPPGYLKSNESGLLMYGVEGKIQDHHDGEEGEIQAASTPDKVLYPGFNAPIDDGVLDRSAEFGMPPFNEWYPSGFNQSMSEGGSSQPFSTPNRQQYGSNASYNEYSQSSSNIDDMEVEDLGNSSHSQIEMYLAVNKASPFAASPQTASDSDGPPPLPDYTPEKRPPPPNHAPEDSITESPLTSIEIGEFLEKAEMKAKKSKIIDTYLTEGQLNDDGRSSHEWWEAEPLSTTAGILYFTYTPPPSLKVALDITDVMKYAAKDLDREPWKTDSTSWYDPLYGDLAAPTGIYDAIKEILKRRKKARRRKKV